MAPHVKRIRLFIAISLLFLALPAWTQLSPKLTVTSAGFEPGKPIPQAYSCDVSDPQSPPLAWKGVPSDAKTLVVIVRDPDAPSGNFIHWVVYNLPATVNGLDARVPATENLPNGGMQGVNDGGQVGYKGPCPPPGSAPHHYHFELSALDTKLDLKPGATAAEVKKAADGHVKAHGELIGTFAR